MRPDAAASMPAFSIVHPSTRTLLIISAIPARSITVLMPRFFKAGIARSREVIEPPVDTVLSTNQKLLMPGTVKRLLFCADDSAGKPASMTRRPIQRSRFRFMGHNLSWQKSIMQKLRLRLPCIDRPAEGREELFE